jgi:hypothetical protein
MKKVMDYRNVILRIEEDMGINMDGKKEECLLINCDIQHIYDPLRGDARVDDHYAFSIEHLNVLLREFKTKGIDIQL